FWASLASKAPGLVNLTTQLPFLGDIAKRVAGITAQRRIPPFAPETFKDWFSRTSRAGRISSAHDRERPFDRPGEAHRRDSSPASPAGTAYESPAQPWREGDQRAEEFPRGGTPTGTVLLWPDTFNNYFLPHTARAAVEVLETAGFEVRI